MQNYISDLSQIDQLITIQIPNISVLGSTPRKFIANNVFSKFTILITPINGYSIVFVNTGITPNEERLLIVECRMKGKSGGEEITTWFNKAHDLQLSFFHNFFVKKILDQWRQ